MKKGIFVYLALLAWCLVTGIAMAAQTGSCSVPNERLENGDITITWQCTSDASAGSVTEVGSIGPITGEIKGVRFMAGTAAPDNLYDVVINTADSIDVLATVGANIAVPHDLATGLRTPLNADGEKVFLIDETLTPAITNAGNSKNIIIKLFLRP